MIAVVRSGAGSFVAGSVTSSIASIAPRPRTSPICGQRACHCSMRARIVFPTVTPRATRSSSSKTSSTASAAASATGLPMYVPPMAPRWAPSMISARPITPESGIPPAIDFATTTRSGSTSKCSIANMRPVRPKPVCTSSATRTIPCSSQIRRSPSTNSADAGMKPPSPCCASNTIAATSSAATCVENMRSMAASAVPASGPR